MIGIIGGSGLYQLIEGEERIIHTPYGETSAPVYVGKLGNKEVAFIPRHGYNHRYPPHRVPYRANLWALRELGVRRVLSVSAVGSLHEDYKPGDFVIPDQFIDFTKGREYTFYDGPRVAHIPMADPFCPDLRERIRDGAVDEGVKVHNSGTYVCIEGPRFSTRAESRLFKEWGGHVIGMTLVPEVNLAREAGMCFANLSMVTDYDVWADRPVDAQEVLRVFRENLEKVRRVLRAAVDRIEDKECSCQRIIDEAFVG